jgi:small redox-active disulfide protein 2
MVIKVLGSGCANCKRLEAVTGEAVGVLGLEASVEKVTDIADIMAFGVMSTPALVIDGEVKLAGRVPTVDEVVKILQRANA